MASATEFPLDLDDPAQLGFELPDYQCDDPDGFVEFVADFAEDGFEHRALALQFPPKLFATRICHYLPADIEAIVLRPGDARARTAPSGEEGRPFALFGPVYALECRGEHNPGTGLHEAI